MRLGIRWRERERERAVCVASEREGVVCEAFCRAREQYVWLGIRTAATVGGGACDEYRCSTWQCATPATTTPWESALLSPLPLRLESGLHIRASGSGCYWSHERPPACKTPRRNAQMNCSTVRHVCHGPSLLLRVTQWQSKA